MEELQRITERLKALTGGKPAFNHFDALRSGTPKGSTIPNITDPVQREIASQVQRMQRLGVKNAAAPGTQATKTVLNAPKAAATGAAKAGALRTAGRVLGPLGAVDTVINIPGSGPLAGTDAEYNPGPLLKVTGQFPYIHTRGSRQNPEAGAFEGKRSVANMGGVSYDLSTPEGERGFSNARKAALKVQTDKGVMPGQLPSDYKETEAAAFSAAAGPATGTDTRSGDRESLRTAPEDERMAAWARANPELAQQVINKKTEQSGRGAIEKEILGRAATETDMASYDKDETFLPSEIPMADRNMTKGFGDRAGSTKARTGTTPDQESQNLLNQYMTDIKGQFADLSAPSAVQNPIPMGGDGTAIDSQLELSKKAGALVPEMANAYKQYR